MTFLKGRGVKFLTFPFACLSGSERGTGGDGGADGDGRTLKHGGVRELLIYGELVHIQLHVLITYAYGASL